MGNLANPLVNRWGLNLFWYNLWFKDKNFNLNNNLISIFKKIIIISLNFGFYFSKNIFISKYFYQSKFFSKNYLNNHYLKYFKFINFKNKLLNIDSFFHKRLTIKNIYFSKIWILMFQNYIIFNIYSFKPLLKKKKKIKIFKPKKNFFIQNNKTTQSIIFKRLNLFFLKILKINLKINYIF